MKKTIFIIIAVVGIIAAAVRSGASPRPSKPIQQPKSITLIVSLTDADIILKGLNELPYKESAGVIQSIMQQAQAQLQPPPQKQDTTKHKKQ